MLKASAFTAVAMLAALAGCTTPRTSSPTAQADGARAIDPNPPASAAEGQMEFGVNLHRQLAGQGGNVMFSPPSITAAFGLVLPGARGDTAEQIRRTLRLTGYADQLAFRSTLPLDQPGRRVAVGNAVWVQQGFPLKPDYARAVTAWAGEPPRRTDFRAPKAAVDMINRWVESRTAGRIKDLLAAGAIEADTKLALVNTIYLKADWASPFLGDDTRDDAFTRPGGGRVTVPFMHQTGQFRLLETSAFQAIELPYKGGELAMVVFLPRAADGLSAFERELTGAILAGWMDRLRAAEPRRVDLALPKLELATRYELPAVLQRMGIVVPFTDRADLSGISDVRPLSVDEVVHQATISVDERGTEAAAATGLTIRVTSAPAPGIPFRADHPFFVVIRDNRSGTPLFMGRVADPSAG